jgi:hypothetical protein
MTDLDVDVSRTKCPFCLEQIIRGARVCKHCGKTQPLSREAKQRRNTRRWIVASVIGVGLVVVFCLSAVWSYDNEENRLAQAAACNGTFTAADLEAMARKSAAAGNMSIYEAEDAAIILACPRMANR